jgi:hypothetical protein
MLGPLLVGLTLFAWTVGTRAGLEPARGGTTPPATWATNWMAKVARLEVLLAELSGEHRQIMRALSEIEKPSAGDTIHARLSKLQRFLLLHFGHEQVQDGLYDLLNLWHSDNARVVAELVEEHKHILTVLDDLIARSTDAGDQASEQISITLGALVAQIRKHEAREAALIKVTTRDP